MPEEQVHALSKWKRVLVSWRYLILALMLLTIALQGWKITTGWWLDLAIWSLQWLTLLAYVLIIVFTWKGDDRIQ
jgi:hypothetical protein